MLICTLDIQQQAKIYIRDLSWSVFAVNGKEPYKGTRGFMDASKATGKIDQWWSRWPDANVGVATGKPSGIIVIDVDPKNGGSLEAFERSIGFKLPDTWLVHTGGGGQHYYFRSPQDNFGDAIMVRNAQGFQGVNGIDVRGDGGFVVAPPSVHRSGFTYLWDAPSLNRPIARWPAFPEWRPREVGVDDDEKFPTGTRNANLVRLAGSMRRYGASRASIIATLHDTNNNRCEPVLTDQEVDEIARRVYNTYAPKFQQPTYSTGRGEGRPSGDSGNTGGRSDAGGVLESRAFRGASQQRNIRSGAWYMGRGR